MKLVSANVARCSLALRLPPLLVRPLNCPVTIVTFADSPSFVPSSLPYYPVLFAHRTLQRVLTFITRGSAADRTLTLIFIGGTIWDGGERGWLVATN